MTREELVEAGARASVNAYGHRDGCTSCRRGAAAVIDAVEPLIRADERAAAERDRNRTIGRLTGECERRMADLRAKVEALLERGISMTWDHPEGFALVRRDEVLALIDGGSE